MPPKILPIITGSITLPDCSFSGDVAAKCVEDVTKLHLSEYNFTKFSPLISCNRSIVSTIGECSEYFAGSVNTLLIDMNIIHMLDKVLMLSEFILSNYVEARVFIFTSFNLIYILYDACS